MDKHKLIYFPLFFFVAILVACGKKPFKNQNPILERSKDSIALEKMEISKKIYIGDDLNPRPLVSQLYHQDEKNYYIMLDKNNLYVFDYESGERTAKIAINSSIENGCGRLNNYSGFYYHSPDSIFLYNYSVKTLFLVDSLSVIKRRWNTVDKNLAKYPVDIEALTSSPISQLGGGVILSGSGHGQPKDATEQNKPVSCLVNVNDETIKYEGSYPQIYRDANFGGVYFNQIFHTVNPYEDEVIYSFPADHYIYKYDANFLDTIKIYAGSRYIKSIESSTGSLVEEYINKEKRIEYYVEQPSYANIIYDKYRNIYYRIATFPILGWKSSDPTFQKPFSIITLDGVGHIISESSVFENPENYNLGNMHVVPEGLAIQKYTEDENVIDFEIYKIDV